MDILGLKARHAGGKSRRARLNGRGRMPEGITEEGSGGVGGFAIVGLGLGLLAGG